MIVIHQNKNIISNMLRCIFSNHHLNFYRVEVHLNQTEGGSPGPWQSVGIVRHVDSKRTYTISALSNVLEPDKDYNFRINTIGDNFEKPMAVFTPGLVSETVNNPCTREYISPSM